MRLEDRRAQYILPQTEVINLGVEVSEGHLQDIAEQKLSYRRSSEFLQK